MRRHRPRSCVDLLHSSLDNRVLLTSSVSEPRRPRSPSEGARHPGTAISPSPDSSRPLSTPATPFELEQVGSPDRGGGSCAGVAARGVERPNLLLEEILWARYLSNVRCFSHRLISATDVDASIDFYSRVLGFVRLFEDVHEEERRCRTGDRQRPAKGVRPPSRSVAGQAVDPFYVSD